ncbi:MAG: BrxA/BrxB family bacilliredoxin [Flavobacteriaceae bacterium]|nr:BrxA/BrxB family bacilliredoxin [Flavobacteriaceae bacterium]
MYPEHLVAPMRLELVNNGFTELFSVSEVEKALSENTSALVVVNSVCGCAAGNARPGVVASLKNSKKPDKLYTVFAGVDKEATDAARSRMSPFPPSSPSIALFINGELVHMIERHHIEGRPSTLISENLIEAYNQFC